MAERFGQLPEVVESQMTEYWFSRALAWIKGESMDIERRTKKKK